MCIGFNGIDNGQKEGRSVRKFWHSVDCPLGRKIEIILSSENSWWKKIYKVCNIYKVNTHYSFSSETIYNISLLTTTLYSLGSCFFISFHQLLYLGLVPYPLHFLWKYQTFSGLTLFQPYMVNTWTTLSIASWISVKIYPHFFTQEDGESLTTLTLLQSKGFYYQSLMNLSDDYFLDFNLFNIC